MALDANGNLTSLADTGYTMADINNFFSKLSADTGAAYEAGDAEQLVAKLMGEGGFIRQLGGNPQGAFDLFVQQYRRRGTGTPGVSPDSSTLNTGSAHPPDPAYAAAQILRANPPAISGNVATMGPSAAAPSGTATGPTGLQAAPNTYSTGSVPTPYGYSSGGGLFAPGPGGGLSTTTLLVLAAVAAGAYYFIKR